MTPADPKQLRHLLRARHRDGYTAVRRALAATGGNVAEACALLGLARPTLYRLASADPELAALLDRHGQGREGASALGVAARLARPKKRSKGP